MKAPVMNGAAGSSAAAATGWRERLLVLFSSMTVAGLIVSVSVAFAPNMKHGTVLVPGTGVTISEEVCWREIVTVKERGR
jgi:hypothetical protein